MPTILELINFNEEFKKINPNEIIILNDLPNRTEDDRSYFDWLIKETHTQDMVSMLPKCRCGELKGEHLIGETCPVCNTEVRQSIEDDIRSTLWFRKPQGIDALIVPQVWLMLQRRFMRKNCNVIQWLCDRSYSPPVKVDIVEKLIAEDIPRGLNNFIRHFDDIFQYLIRCKDFESKRLIHKMMKGMVGMSETDDVLDRFIQDHRDRIFTDYLPIPNRALLVVESTFLGKFVENHVLDIHNILNTMLSIDRDHYEKKPHAIENRTAKILNMLSNYYYGYVGSNLRPKEGQFRKHVNGTRANFSFRAVITSHEDIRSYDEIHIPWGVAVTTFWLHHMSILLDREHPLGGMTHTEATNFLMDHVEKYHPRLEALFDLMIQSRPRKCIGTLLQRNPSLMQGSSQYVRITKVKKNPKDTTVSMSDLIATAPNADYDGRSNIVAVNKPF